MKEWGMQGEGMEEWGMQYEGIKEWGMQDEGKWSRISFMLRIFCSGGDGSLPASDVFHIAGAEKIAANCLASLLLPSNCSEFDCQSRAEKFCNLPFPIRYSIEK